MKTETIISAGIRKGRIGATRPIIQRTSLLHGGFTQFVKGKVTKLGAPMDNRARDRTIRIHELLHSNNSPKMMSAKKYPVLAQQAIEDMYVHALYWPDTMPDSINRDQLTMALSDIRKMPAMADIGANLEAWNEAWNVSLLIALRCFTILKRFSNNGKHLDLVKRKMRAAFGPRVASSLRKLNLLYAIHRKNRKMAIAQFVALMQAPPPQDAPTKIGGSNKPGGMSGGASRDPMRIVHLPMPDRCDSSTPLMAIGKSGRRLHRPGIVPAIVSGSASRLFCRTRSLLGGTVLIDASGSMNLSEESLNELCRKVPGATVAYYSGLDDPTEDGVYGDLVIYAQDGYRANQVARRHNGNDIDLYAIQWLLGQKAPRTYIGDLGFCGGPNRQDEIIDKLFPALVASGQIRWIDVVKP